MARSIKTAVSFPEALYRRAEAYRRKTGRSRSGLYAAALEAYFGILELRENERRYEAGYKVRPEVPAELEAGLKAGLPSWGPPEDW